MRFSHFPTLLRVLLLLPTFISAVNDRAGARFQLVGCNDRDVDGLYDDAIRLAENAVEWLDKIPGWSFIRYTERNNAANNLRFMFGITKSELNGDDGKARLKAIRDAYVKVINALKTGQGMPLTDSFLVCGDTSLTRTTNMADLGPLGAPEQDFTAMYGANGVWYASQPRTPGSDTVRVIFTTLPTFSPPICFDTRAGNAGQTVAGQMFHPRALRTDPNEEILRDAMDQNVRKIVICDVVWDKERFRPAILQDKGKDASEGITLNPDLIKNRGGVLLHEMFHMIDTDVPNEYKWLDKTLNTGETAYLFSKSVKLAMEYRPDASTNPDNYRIFADMVWWSKTRWHGDVS